ncbi:MAG: DUF3500 domain-containing protein [Runella slithyformis]|nr:MAG: DUF3500 domain-containing protein [Runella slithyformis]
MQQAAQNFLSTLSTEQKDSVNLPFDSEWRFDWNYTPRYRKGLPFKKMTSIQKTAAIQLIKTGLSQEGMAKAEAIIALEYVLRQVEKRPENDTYRDPEHYAILICGVPHAKNPWSWRVEGHHLSLHYTLTDGKVQFMPSFMGSNPAIVLPGYVQEGKQVLKSESDLAFELLRSFDDNQRKQVILSEKAPSDMLTANKRKAILEKREGLPLGEMTKIQQNMFRTLLQAYFDRYPVTLKKQALKRIKAANLKEITFAWMGDSAPLRGDKRGHYYRIHGPTLLIEFDNTQNQGNHVHCVVRDLTDDWGEDLLKMHYQSAHDKK